ncbi:MAG: 3-isopropylmalate dehydratase small subunit [Chloroflexi bacterium]|nr:3-isopropylmalate dehydratase small subunit [Chloroflexota bacterium]
MKISGKARLVGDKVSAESILPSAYLTAAPQKLGKHALEGIDPTFVQRVVPGDILVAGRFFGGGSSREQATLALKYCGISAVVAESFARIFFRNALNLGLPALECSWKGRVEEGDDLAIDVEAGEVRNLRTGEVFHAPPLPPFLISLLAGGGLIEQIKRQAVGL